jgi:hypothetical protein
MVVGHVLAVANALPFVVLLAARRQAVTIALHSQTHQRHLFAPSSRGEAFEPIWFEAKSLRCAFGKYMNASNRSTSLRSYVEGSLLFESHREASEGH